MDPSQGANCTILASMKRLTTVQLDTSPGESLLNITDQVQAAVRDSGLAEGIYVVSLLLTPCTLSTLNFRLA
jgi:thiamine phosphate synthase YjbQ (UPF0047 family)